MEPDGAITTGLCLPLEVSPPPCERLQPSILILIHHNLLPVLCRPVRIVDDPFRGAPHILVLCECLSKDMVPLAGATRSAAVEIFEKDVAAEPWFGIEQEYTLFEADGITPLGWPVAGFPAPQGPYYCGVSQPRPAREYCLQIASDYCTSVILIVLASSREFLHAYIRCSVCGLMQWVRGTERFHQWSRHPGPD